MESLDSLLIVILHGKWKNINIKYLTRYVALTTDRKTIEDLGLGEVVPIPKPTTSLNSFTNPASNSTAKATNGDSQFSPINKEPSRKQLKILLGIAVSVGSETCMGNHVYTINGEVRRQMNGGAIGSVLTGDNARLYMMRWDKKYKQKLKTLGISMKL